MQYVRGVLFDYIKNSFKSQIVSVLRKQLDNVRCQRSTNSQGDAVACEKKLKGWRRSRKIALIEQTNPRWLDLSDDWEQQPKVYDRPWDTDEMIRDSSLRSE